MVICEYAPKGTLYQFLRNCHISGRQDYLSNGNCSKTSFMLSPSELLTFALQIAKGMQHLALMRCVHGDLAARNVLVGDGNVMKISGFGLVQHDKSCHQQSVLCNNEEVL